MTESGQLTSVFQRIRIFDSPFAYICIYNKVDRYCSYCLRPPANKKLFACANCEFAKYCDKVSKQNRIFYFRRNVRQSFRDYTRFFRSSLLTLKISFFLLNICWVLHGCTKVGSRSAVLIGSLLAVWHLFLREQEGSNIWMSANSLRLF